MERFPISQSARMPRIRPGEVFDYPTAVSLAEANQADETDGWTYRVQLDPDLYNRVECYRVAIFDECSTFIGYL